MKAAKRPAKGSVLTEREAALAIVERVVRSDHETASNLLSHHLERHGLPTRDRALLTELVYGTLRRIPTLDWIISRYARRVKEPLLRNILRLGVYQIYCMRTPPHAAVHPWVELAKERVGREKAGFVNAVLRRAASKEFVLTEQALIKKGLSKEEAWGVAYGLPSWMLQRWQGTYSPQEIRQIAEASAATPHVFARAHGIARDKLCERLHAEGMRAQAADHPAMIRLEAPHALESLRAFREGLFFVQDPMTVAVVDFMQVGEADSVLDLCAAPGGKAFALEERLKDGFVLAAEQNPARLALAKDNARRLRSKVRWLASAELRWEQDKKFDKILLDVPCSNLGVLGRRVELRMRLNPKRLQAFGRKQQELLKEAMPWVKPGGAIYYSTCSIDPEENEQRVEAFARAHEGWKVTRQLRMLPEAGKQDGGFVAEIRRT